MSISVLMPVYNGERYLADSLASVLPQLAENDELLAQDGGSSDRTLDILREQQQTYPQLSVVSERDFGQTDALIKALGRARGDYVSWLNCDDLVAPGALDHVRRHLLGTSPDIVYGDFQVIDAVDHIHRTLSPDSLSHERLLRKGCYVFSGATYFRRAALERVGFDADLHYCMDFDLFLRLTASADLRSLHIPQVLGAFRFHDESKSGSLAREFVVEACRVRIAAMRSSTGGSSFRSRLRHVVAPTAIDLLKTFTARLRYTTVYARLRGSTHGV